MTGRELRAAIRAGEHRGPTANVGAGLVQANLVIVPEAHALDFARFCQRNPRPCPVLAISDTGSPDMAELGEDLDLRTDLPRYRIWRDGRLVDEPDEIGAVWRDDLVAFALGCSFSFDHALVAAGLNIRHIEQGRNVPMYRTDRPTRAAGRFAGPLVVSMRPMDRRSAQKATEITASYPFAHGAPVHSGDPAALGIEDLARPDYGDAVDLRDGEEPVFWACGVTPQAAIETARLDFCITHAPGHMLVTDIENSRLLSNPTTNSE